MHTSWLLVPTHNLVSALAWLLKSNTRQYLINSHPLPKLATALAHKLAFFQFQFSLYFWHPGNYLSSLKIEADIRELPQTSIPHPFGCQKLPPTFLPVTTDEPSLHIRPIPLLGH